jgi:hypothetical protein
MATIPALVTGVHDKSSSYSSGRPARATEKKINYKNTPESTAIRTGKHGEQHIVGDAGARETQNLEPRELGKNSKPGRRQRRIGQIQL